MTSLLKNIESYRSTRFKELESHYASLKNSQSPETLIITCSDSRLCPQEFTQSKAGDLFVIRNAGNLIPPYCNDNVSNEALTLEYGVSVLKVKEIIVLGHTQCGAMSGLINLESLSSLRLVQKALTSYYTNHSSELKELQSLDQVICWNVRNQLKKLMTYSFIKEGVEGGSLSLFGMVYNFREAKIEYKCLVTRQGEVSDEI